MASPLSRKYFHLTFISLTVFSLIGVDCALAGRTSLSLGIPMLWFLAGCAGAIISTYSRLSAIAEGEPRTVNALESWRASLQLYVSTCIGGVFAMVLWSIFFSGLLKGPLFPTFNGTEDVYKDFRTLMESTRPATNADTAKTLLWSFIAGYSEKFVPNLLDKLADEAKKQKETDQRQGDSDVHETADQRAREQISEHAE